ncbi:hypothetical protein GCM10023322_53720 [Rugosimonospora acidiphila]|uniref:Uncharacterized protein n=1 Tax=Rugosimonospora acidiphila TaxID=556531 RepID=A0ABP9S949_9ACTN
MARAGAAAYAINGADDEIASTATVSAATVGSMAEGRRGTVSDDRTRAGSAGR